MNRERRAEGEGVAEGESAAEGSRPVEAVRVREGRARDHPDQVAHEEPLEIQVDGAPLAVVMRTPGDDLELVTGFLVTERIVTSRDQIASLRHASQAKDPESADNLVRVRLQAGVTLDLEKLRRNLFAASSCGICGKASIDNALATAPPLEDDARFEAELFYDLPERMRGAQRVFEETGGLHGAALFDASGRLLVAREDVGRHNAVDKVVGWAARSDQLPLSGRVLLVSGRVSFEVVQKALAARIPVVAAVSAPSSLAVQLAADAGMAIVGFLRGRELNVYGARDRIEAPGR